MSLFSASPVWHLIRLSPPVLGLLALLFFFARCQPEPVGAPLPQNESPKPFEQVWFWSAGDSVAFNFRDFNKRLITYKGRVFLFYEAGFANLQGVIGSCWTQPR